MEDHYDFGGRLGTLPPGAAGPAAPPYGPAAGAEGAVSAGP